MMPGMINGSDGLTKNIDSAAVPSPALEDWQVGGCLCREKMPARTLPNKAPHCFVIIRDGRTTQRSIKFGGTRQAGAVNGSDPR